jgi:hypothetical protein
MMLFPAAISPLAANRISVEPGMAVSRVDCERGS